MNFNRPYPPPPGGARYSPSAPFGDASSATPTPPAPYPPPHAFPPFSGKGGLPPPPPTMPPFPPVPYARYDEYEPGEARGGGAGKYPQPARGAFDYAAPPPPRPPQGMPAPRRSYDYDAPRAAFAYDQPYEDAYDPSRPTPTAGPPLPGPSHAPPPAFVPPPAHLSSLAPAPPPALPAFSPAGPAAQPTAAAPRRPADRNAPDLPLLTPVTMTTIGSETVAVHALPASALPITKYVAVNAADSVDVHRALCASGLSRALWYAAGATRAGEGWCAAVEWDLDAAMSRSKLRACVAEPDGGPAPVHDALTTELAALAKTVEGFAAQLAAARRQARPAPPSLELVVFCDSAAAIVAADTAAHPQAARFRASLRQVCTEHPGARLTLAWVARGSDVEGYVLADKIAHVAASNSYLRRKKERTVPDVYNRFGGGEPLAGASTEPGPWQHGDADPGRPKTPFEPPQPLPPVEAAPAPLAELARPASPRRTPAPSRSPSPVTVPVLDLKPRPRSRSRSHEMAADGALGFDTGADMRLDDDSVHPRADALCIANFPDSISAKDLGMLFTQFGDIVSVDIFSVPPVRPRFAYVTYVDPEPSIAAAIAALHDQPVRLDTAYARDNAADLAGWRGFAGALAVVRSDPARLVPASVAGAFPDLPDYATAGGERRRRRSSAERKRPRAPSIHVKHEPRSPSPKKARQDGADDSDDGFGGLAQAFNSAAPVAPEPAQPEAVAQPTASVLVPNYSAPPPLTPVGLAPRPPAAQPTQATHASLPPTPLTAHDPAPRTSPASLPPRPAPCLPPGPPHSQPPSSQAPSQAGESQDARPGLTNSAATPQATPVSPGARTLRAQLALARRVLVKHDRANWIAHACLLATDLDSARRALQADLYATDEAFISGRALERALADKGFTPARVDAFIRKVLKVLDGIAAADEAEAAALGGGGGADGSDAPAPAAGADGAGGAGGTGGADGASGASGAAGADDDDAAAPAELAALRAELDGELARYPPETREAMAAAATVMEYLHRGRAAQARKRLDVERRVRVLEGMARIGEHVGSVVRFLLTEDR